MDLFVKCHEEVILEVLDSTLRDMEEIVEKVPQAILDFNKFIKICKDV